MSLQSRLDAFKADFESGKPPYHMKPEWIATMHRATAALRTSGAAERARKVGEPAPAFSLADADGKPVSSADLLAKGSLIVTFYRGIWCPYCNIELQAMQAQLPAYQRLGVSLVAISPQTPPNSRKSMRQNQLSFPILSDVGGAVGEAFGLRFELPPDLRELYLMAQIDLPAFNDDPSWKLSMPARYGIGRDGVIRYAAVHPDYTQRPEPEEVLEALGI